MNTISKKDFREFHKYLKYIFNEHSLYFIGSGFCPDHFPICSLVKEIIYLRNINSGSYSVNKVEPSNFKKTILVNRPRDEYIIKNDQIMIDHTKGLIYDSITDSEIKAEIPKHYDKPYLNHPVVDFFLYSRKPSYFYYMNYDSFADKLRKQGHYVNCLHGEVSTSKNLLLAGINESYLFEPIYDTQLHFPEKENVNYFFNNFAKLYLNFYFKCIGILGYSFFNVNGQFHDFLTMQVLYTHALDRNTLVMLINPSASFLKPEIEYEIKRKIISFDIYWNVFCESFFSDYQEPDLYKKYIIHLERYFYTEEKIFKKSYLDELLSLVHGYEEILPVKLISNIKKNHEDVHLFNLESLTNEMIKAFLNLSEDTEYRKKIFYYLENLKFQLLAYLKSR